MSIEVQVHFYPDRIQALGEAHVDRRCIYRKNRLRTSIQSKTGSVMHRSVSDVSR